MLVNPICKAALICNLKCDSIFKKKKKKIPGLCFWLHVTKCCDCKYGNSNNHHHNYYFILHYILMFSIFLFYFVKLQ